MEGCYDQGVSVDHAEWCLGCCPKTRGEVCCDFKVDLQDQACCKWQHREYKAGFVARGFSQKEGIDYEETFAFVARYTSI